jgi:hypothetical protein
LIFDWLLQAAADARRGSDDTGPFPQRVKPDVMPQWAIHDRAVNIAKHSCHLPANDNQR